ncbi:MULTISPECIES: GTPase ObgE [Clostridium]|uniref:GTPase Obg n=4 Tax=Clostridium TaxID=1485 RepID=D8GNW3_CLOLD|nr:MULTISPECIES: GTPase ObgE [Clostridium]ADK13809.1 predicted obgE, GTPase [Clostridium ljungdahlii DSM 13528]AGY77038.1 GTPase ObgE [Clostridium autoethanogenum DSM 10061]ALU37180.1 GTPase obg [Clostridium autoethanogenum DSM 10061]OAA85057.1 GTPase ObgE [Clostridium ljungdahlii DSM 13528]OAA91542.1 GTPase ObgE [Clostridium coskatii]
MFVDTAKIFVTSGDGGDGSISFRREKYVAFGGPDGGDGGKGGDVILVVDTESTTLLDFAYRKKYRAEKGENGAGSKCFGRNGKDLYIKVPMGTVVKDVKTNKIMADLAHPEDKCIVAKGGRGGRGNVRFTTPVRQAPDFAEPGMPGEERYISLELKLLADVGLLGFPNVGKSTLLSIVTKATPKIANYHFTTLSPNLGVTNISGIKSFVIADIPGIIEGAAEGVGLGIEFLRHIQRTRLLIHVVDISGIEGRDAFDDFTKINNELKKYDVKLWDKPQIIAANKSDMLYDNELFENFRKKVGQLGYDKVFKISAATGQGVKELMKEAARILSTIPVENIEINEEDKFVPEEKKFTYNIRKEENTFIVEGSFVDRLLGSVNVNDPDELRYFYKVLKNKGVMQELMDMGIKDGDVVKLNDFEFDYVM